MTKEEIQLLNKQHWEKIRQSHYKRELKRILSYKRPKPQESLDEIEQRIAKEREERSYKGLLLKREKRCIDLMLSGQTPKDAARLAGFSIKKGNFNRWLLKLLNKQSALEYMSSKLQNALKTLGMTEEWVLERLRDEAQRVENKGLERLQAIMIVGKLNAMFHNPDQTEKDDLLTDKEIKLLDQADEIIS